MSTEYFTRDGSPFPVTPAVVNYGPTDEREGFGANLTRPCVRCGGAGGSDKWAATGWKCFRCDGHCVDPERRFQRAYTAAELVKLNAAQAKAHATRAAKAEAKRAEQAAAADAARDGFVALFGEWLAAARDAAGHVEFVADILDKAVANVRITSGQFNAVNDVCARELEKRTHTHLGAVGDKITVEGRVVWNDTRPGFAYNTVTYLYMIATKRGVAFFRGSTPLGQTDDVVRFVATIKELSESRKDGSPLTIVARPRKWELVEEGKYRRRQREDEEYEAEQRYLKRVAGMVQDAGSEASREGRSFCRISDRSEWPKPVDGLASIVH